MRYHIKLPFKKHRACCCWFCCCWNCHGTACLLSFAPSPILGGQRQAFIQSLRVYLPMYCWTSMYLDMRWVCSREIGVSSPPWEEDRRDKIPGEDFGTLNLQSQEIGTNLAPGCRLKILVFNPGGISCSLRRLEPISCLQPLTLMKASTLQNYNKKKRPIPKPRQEAEMRLDNWRLFLCVRLCLFCIEWQTTGACGRSVLGFTASYPRAPQPELQKIQAMCGMSEPT